jgi:hypothetical protein
MLSKSSSSGGGNSRLPSAKKSCQLSCSDKGIIPGKQADSKGMVKGGSNLMTDKGRSMVEDRKEKTRKKFHKVVDGMMEMTMMHDVCNGIGPEAKVAQLSGHGHAMLSF